MSVEKSSVQFVKELEEILSENKAYDIQTFKMKEFISENVIIATSLNSVHSFALSEKIVEYAKNMGKFCIVDGDAKDGWVAVELPFANTLIHLMVKEKRDYYNIEEILEKKWIPSV